MAVVSPAYARKLRSLARLIEVLAGGPPKLQKEVLRDLLRNAERDGVREISADWVKGVADDAERKTSLAKAKTAKAAKAKAKANAKPARLAKKKA